MHCNEFVATLGGQIDLGCIAATKKNIAIPVEFIVLIIPYFCLSINGSRVDLT